LAVLAELPKPWRAIRKAVGLDDVRLHDLRHAFTSVAASSGMDFPIISKRPGHTQAQTTVRYADHVSDPVKAAAATVAGKIATLGSGESRDEGAAVLPLRSGGDGRV
jgi:integrase